MVKIMGVRDLNMYDRSEIKKLDAISGNDVWMYAEDKRLETSFFDEEGNFTGSAFGLFAKGDPAGNSLIGYCSLGLADCLEIDVDGYNNPSDMNPAFLDKFFPGKEIRLEYVSSEPGCDLYWTNRPDFAGKYHVEYLDPEGNDTIFIDASSKTDVLKELTNHMIKQNPNALSKIKSLGGDINSIDTIYAELADSEYSGFEYSGFTEYLSVAKWEHVNPCECD